ncbi:hypothetical protein [Sorangium sp. So ce117]|uniref:hypothetical protein n=1 Tax=Sorangium sp. So ce117 TaxID=3133277 RepID=UPI003F5EB0C3
MKRSAYESAKRSRNSSEIRPAARCARIDASKPAIASGILPRARSTRARLPIARAWTAGSAPDASASSAEDAASRSPRRRSASASFS